MGVSAYGEPLQRSCSQGTLFFFPEHPLNLISKCSSNWYPRGSVEDTTSWDSFQVWLPWKMWRSIHTLINLPTTQHFCLQPSIPSLHRGQTSDKLNYYQTGSFRGVAGVQSCGPGDVAGYDWDGANGFVSHTVSTRKFSCLHFSHSS